ncbi:MAG: hypothetical protein OK449_04695 [Thaumarchaeota archaeon]|nr:hypothetical protein [Nitrososphaerota archaeon]
MRSVWVPWSVAVGESERLLDDLSRNTKVDGIELLDFDSQNLEKASYNPVKKSAVRVLPSSGGFDLPLVTKERFVAAQRFMHDAKSRGFKITCNSVPLWLGAESLKKTSLVDVTGRHLTGPSDFPVYGCPNNPDMVRYGEFMTRELVSSWPDMEIMALNHLEYPHILLWTYPGVDVDSMFACFCKSCEKAAKEQGIDFALMKKEAKSLLNSLSRPALKGKRGLPPPVNTDDVVNFFLKRPHLAQWLRFRMDSMTSYTRALIAAGREAAKEHNPKLRIGMEFQLPSLSPILGTDFLALSSDLDLMIPKFPDYLPGSVIPQFAKEVASRGGLDRGALLKVIRDAFDLGPGPEKYASYPELSHILLYSNAYDFSVFERQMKYLRPLVGKVGIQPYIWESNNDGKSLKRKIEALSKLGFDDFFLWNWEEGLSSTHLRELKGIL